MTGPRVQPADVFIEVPYKLVSAWTSGGFTWDACLDAKGLPSIVLKRMTMANQIWCHKVVRVWHTFADYQRETHEDGCREGRAFLGPPHEGSPLPVRFLTGCMSRPIVTGQRRKWKW